MNQPIEITEVTETKSKFSWEDFPRYMRAIGAVALTASAVTFLFQGYAQLSSFYRFLSFFGMVGSLGLAGLGCLRLLKEVKGARTFMALLTAGVPVLFAQLGAMIFYLFGTKSSSLPELLTFSALTTTEIAIAGGLLMVVMAPAAFAGLRILTRERASVLSAAFLALNSLLLIPLRLPEVTAGLLTAASFFLVYLTIESAKSRVSFSTLESKIAHIILAAPVAILAVRGLFYDHNMIVLSTSLAVMGVGALTVSRVAEVEEKMDRFLQFVGIVGVSGAWCLISHQLNHFYYLPNWAETSVSAVGCGLLLIGLQLLNVLKAKGYARFGSAIAGGVSAYNAIWHLNIVTASVVTILGVLFLLLAFERRDKIIFDVAMVSLGASLIANIGLGIDYFSSWPWLSLGVLGVVVIVAASWLESRHGEIWTKMRTFVASLN